MGIIFSRAYGILVAKCVWRKISESMDRGLKPQCEFYMLISYQKKYERPTHFSIYFGPSDLFFWYLHMYLPKTFSTLKILSP